MECSSLNTEHSRLPSASIRLPGFLPATLAINSRRLERMTYIAPPATRDNRSIEEIRSPGTVGDPLLNLSLSLSLASLPNQFILCSSRFTLETAASLLLYLINALPFTVRRLDPTARNQPCFHRLIISANSGRAAQTDSTRREGYCDACDGLARSYRVAMRRNGARLDSQQDHKDRTGSLFDKWSLNDGQKAVRPLLELERIFHDRS